MRRLLARWRCQAYRVAIDEALDLVERQNKLLFEQNQLIHALNNRVAALQEVSKN